MGDISSQNKAIAAIQVTRWTDIPPGSKLGEGVRIGRSFFFLYQGKHITSPSVTYNVQYGPGRLDPRSDIIKAALAFKLITKADVREFTQEYKDARVAIDLRSDADQLAKLIKRHGLALKPLRRLLAKDRAWRRKNNIPASL